MRLSDEKPEFLLNVKYLPARFALTGFWLQLTLARFWLRLAIPGWLTGFWPMFWFAFPAPPPQPKPLTTSCCAMHHGQSPHPLDLPVLGLSSGLGQVHSDIYIMPNTISSLNNINDESRDFNYGSLIVNDAFVRRQIFAIKFSDNEKSKRN